MSAGSSTQKRNYECPKKEYSKWWEWLCCNTIRAETNEDGPNAIGTWHAGRPVPNSHFPVNWALCSDCVLLLCQITQIESRFLHAWVRINYEVNTKNTSVNLQRIVLRQNLPWNNVCEVNPRVKVHLSLANLRVNLNVKKLTLRQINNA